MRDLREVTARSDRRLPRDQLQPGRPLGVLKRLRRRGVEDVLISIAASARPTGEPPRRQPRQRRIVTVTSASDVRMRWHRAAAGRQL